MTIKRALRLLALEYERAKKLEYVRNPTAWALFQVWKYADRYGRDKNEDEKKGDKS